MNRSIYKAFLTIGLLIAFLSAVKAQEAGDSISNTILARMPLAYRDQAKRLARLTDEIGIALRTAVGTDGKTL